LNTADELEVDALKRAMALLERSREAQSSELVRRARAIAQGRCRGKRWEETKREILGTAP
jgi:hypothetical protein